MSHLERIRPYQLEGKAYALWDRVLQELGPRTASKVCQVLAEEEDPKHISLEHYERKIIRDIAQDMDMECPV